VFSTLHTNDSSGGISRLVDMGVEPFLVAASVRAFLAQRLVRRLCHHCRRAVEAKQDYLAELGFPADEPVTIYEAVGCRECRGTGFHGRLAVYELVLLTPRMQDIIVHKGTYSELKEQALKDGFQPMRGYGWQKVVAGETTLEEVISVTSTEFEVEEEADLEPIR
jgi:type II secretory ATPase GspE/PulE/Tfp pilus assembly ATPase PilB-like protein